MLKKVAVFLFPISVIVVALLALMYITTGNEMIALVNALVVLPICIASAMVVYDEG